MLLLWLASILTNQCGTFLIPLFQGKTNVSMPHDETMYSLVYLGWNAILVKNQSSTILQQHTQCMKGYKFGCFQNNSRNEKNWI